MRRTLQICFFFAVAIFSTFTKLNAAAAEHKVSPRTAYTAVYEVKGLGQSSMLTEYSDGTRFVRQENSISNIPLSQIKLEDGSTCLCLTLGAHNAIAITSKENKVQQIEGCFGNDNTIVLENFGSLKPSLKTRKGISKSFALMPSLVKASSSSSPEPPPLPKRPRFYKPASYKPTAGKATQLMVNGLSISCQSPDPQRREVLILFPSGEKVNISATNQQITQVTCSNGIMLKRASNQEMEEVPFNQKTSN